MGNGNWDSTRYNDDAGTRAAAGKPAFEYTQTATQVHPNLDPSRIRSKPFGKLESRDNSDHPNSWSVIINLDVTGSNQARAMEAQVALPTLMERLALIKPDPQVAIWANDDITARGAGRICPVQMADFESDNRVDEHLRNLWITGDGGGNGGESYDLILYAAARKTILDCQEKRGEKGYLFLYADEPFWWSVNPDHIKQVFGDNLEASIPIQQMALEVQNRYHLFVLSPAQEDYPETRSQYTEIFGARAVHILEAGSGIVDKVISLVTQNEAELAKGKPGLVPAPPLVLVSVGAERL